MHTEENLGVKMTPREMSLGAYAFVTKVLRDSLGHIIAFVVNTKEFDLHPAEVVFEDEI